MVLAGAIWIVRNREPFGLHCLAACLVIVGWLSGYRWKEERLVTAILPLLAIVAAVGLTRTFASARPAIRLHVVRVVIVVAIVAFGSAATRPVFQSRIALGYPSFLDAMRWLRAHSSPEAVVIGANYPQIFWYADRHARDLPEKPGLEPALAGSEWVIVTNFERGQKDYAADLLKKVSRADIQAGDAMQFRDRQFQTILIRSRILRERP